MTVWLTVADVEMQTGIPNATIRRYIRYHGHHVPQRKTGKSYMIDEHAVNVFKQIRDMYQRGMSTEQVEETLADMGRPMTITVHDEQMTVSTSEAIQHLQNQMANDMAKMYHQIDELKQAVESSLQESAASREETERLQKVINERLDERDRLLTETLIALREQRASREEASKREKRSWWPFGR